MKVCVFCGSSTRVAGPYLRTAEALGEALVRRGIPLVYGGSSIGLMGRLADRVLGLGGEVIGVIPQHLVDREVGHQRLTDLRIVSGMHERKALMHALADAYVVLPGGLGTMEELFETLAWAAMGLHRKPIALLDVEGYFRPLLTFLAHAAAEAFIRREDLNLIMLDDDPERLLDLLQERRAALP